MKRNNLVILRTNESWMKTCFVLKVYVENLSEAWKWLKAMGMTDGDLFERALLAFYINQNSNVKCEI